MSKNKLKTEKPESKKPRGNDPNVLKQEKEAEVKVKELVKDERTHKVMGVVCLLLAVYCFIAFTSYLFTWEEDQDKVFRYSASILLMDMDNVKVENLLGRLGAFVSHWFFYKGFGIASYLFCYLFFILGVNFIVGRRVFRIWRNVKYLLFGLVFISTTAAFVSSFADFPWGGAMGEAISKWMSGFLGRTGAALLLMVAGLAWLIWKYNLDFAKWLERKPKAEPATAPSAVPEPLVVSTPPPAHAATANNRKNGLKEGNVSVIPPPSETEGPAEMQLIERSESITLIPPPAQVHEEEEEEIEEEVEEEEEEAGPLLYIEETVEPASRKKKPATEDVAWEIKPPVVEEEDEEEPVRQPVQMDPYEPTLDLRDYKYPSLELLDNHNTEKIVQDAGELDRNKNQIIDTLKNYDISIQKISATVGPTVTLYEIVPAAGVRISRIKNLEDDIALSLSALGIRIIAPIPGKGTIGIEVPNVKKSMVSLRNLLASEKFQQSSMELPIAIGKKIDNENFIADLAKMPHLLMAGATGQGKSVGINTLLVSLLYKKHPSQLKFVLVDPKKVELSLYKLIEKHFLAKLPGEEEAIITDTKKVIHTLNALCIEMDLRYDLLKEAGTRNIREYNNKFVQRRLNPQRGHRYLPFVVLVIDEFADLIMTAG
ncbi:MAG TPA: DNA translocase FtsK 4TM domain-containing protein, partial [Chitinophaga sp.]|nr:DNA translocase FtsK 4TM domain-containing protein [Chitinophaga sp.]